MHPWWRNGLKGTRLALPGRARDSSPWPRDQVQRSLSIKRVNHEILPRFMPARIQNKFGAKRRRWREKNKNKCFLMTHTEATFIRLPVLNLMMDSGGFSKTVQTTMPAGEYCNIIDSCSSKVRLGSVVLLRWDQLKTLPPRWDYDQLFHQGEPVISCWLHHFEPLIFCATRLRF